MKHLPKFFLVVDLGFVVYWLITAFHLIDETYLYNGYTNPILVAWNWSFFPLDMAISGSGFYSLFFFQLQWWLPNLFLLIYPLFFIFWLSRDKSY